MGEGDPPRVTARPPLFFTDAFRMAYLSSDDLFLESGLRPFDVAPDGRFLVMTRLGEDAPASGASAQVVVVVNPPRADPGLTLPRHWRLPGVGRLPPQ